MTEKQFKDPEREAVLNALQAMRDGRLDTEGGYPADIDGSSVPGYILIADVDHDRAPTLTVHRWRDAIRWYHRALRFLEDHPDFRDDIASAMYETSQGM
jgi:hypothetical protein